MNAVNTVRAPEFPADLTWFNTEPLRLAALRGKIVLLEFWTSGCINCHHNIPELHTLTARYRDEVVVIGVHSAKFPAEHAAPNVRAAVERHGIRYPVVSDREFAIWNHYAVRAWPTLVVIDPDGRIEHTHMGEWRADEVASIIDQRITTWEQRGTLNREPVMLTPEQEAEPQHVLQYPSKLALSPSGDLYVSDTGHNRIVRVRVDHAQGSGEIVDVWGGGEPALRDGVGHDAAFHHPRGLALHGEILYVADTDNHAIRAIDLQTGMVRTVAGDGTKAHGPIVPTHPTQTSLRSPWALVASKHGITMAMAGSHQLWTLRDDSLQLLAGTRYETLEDGSALTAGFSQPSDLALHGDVLYVVDAETSAVRSVHLGEGTVATLVGRGLFTFGDQDGEGDDVRMQHPTGLTYHEGMLFVADTFNNKIKRLDPATRQVQTLIGTGVSGHADGAFTEATLYEPEGVAASGDVLFIADTNNHQIRVADLVRGTVRTLFIVGPQGLLVPQRTTVRLDPITVGVGSITLNLDVALPPGYKHNPDAPLTLALPECGVTRTFGADESPSLILDVAHDLDVVLDLTVYPCHISDGLCLIHDVRLTLPLTVTEEGPLSVHVPYAVPDMV